MTTPDRVRCENCAHSDNVLSLCRRYPPDLTGAWPPNTPNDWCGEWKDRLNTDLSDPLSSPSVFTPYRRAQTL